MPDLAPLLAEQSGVIEVADGEYTICDFGPPAQPRSEPLVLKAQTPHGVRIVPRGTSVAAHVGFWDRLDNTYFIGVDTRDVRINHRGCSHVKWWYADMTYPWTSHPTPGSGPLEQAAQAVQFYNTDFPDNRRSNNCGLYGCDVHDVGDDAVEIKRADSISIVGTKLRRVIPPPEAQYGDVWHDDAFQLAGACQNVLVEDSWIDDRITIGPESKHNQESFTATFRRCWVSGSPGSGWTLNVNESTQFPTPTCIVTIDRTDVRSWGHKGVDTYITSHPELFDINDVNYVKVAPPVGAVDPATLWQQAHPVDSWASYFGIGQPMNVTVSVADKQGNMATAVATASVA